MVYRVVLQAISVASTALYQAALCIPNRQAVSACERNDASGITSVRHLNAPLEMRFEHKKVVADHPGTPRTVFSLHCTVQFSWGLPAHVAHVKAHS